MSAPVSVPLIHHRRGVTVRVDADEWDSWRAAGLDTRWEWTTEGPVYPAGGDSLQPVADTILGCPARFVDGDVFNLQRSNLAPVNGGEAPPARAARAPKTDRNPMTNKNDTTPAPSEEREFGAGTTLTHVEGLAAYAGEAQAATLADQKAGLEIVKTVLPCGTVVETVHGADFSIRVAEDRRDRSAVG